MIGRLMTLACASALALALTTGAARAETLEVDGGRLWYETCGKGSTAIVLLHDGLLHSEGFDGVWQRLCRAFRVVRYDRRGYGRSPIPTAAYSPVEDLAAMLRALGLERASLVGVSSGGGVALNYALEHPDTVERLVLVGAAVDGLKTSDHFDKRNTRVATPMIVGNVDGVIANAAKDPWLVAPGHDAARATFVALMKANPQNIRRQVRSPARASPPAPPRMPGLKVPTLILTGEHDIPDVHAMAGAAQALIAGSRREVVADSGHLVQLEQPEKLADLVAEFVRKGR